jgi:hypothetical protein
MKAKLLTAAILLSAFCMNAQQLMLIDRFNGNKIVNDSTITVFSSDIIIFDLTQYFTMKNNTDQTLSVNLRKSINQMNDRTSDYFCFSVKCWPFEDPPIFPLSFSPEPRITLLHHTLRMNDVSICPSPLCRRG